MLLAARSAKTLRAFPGWADARGPKRCLAALVGWFEGGGCWVCQTYPLRRWCAALWEVVVL